MTDQEFYEEQYSDYKEFPDYYKKLVEYSVKFKELVPLGFQQPSEEELAKAIKENAPLQNQNDGTWY